MNTERSAIRVDIDDLMDRLNNMKEDDYVTAQLEIVSENYDSELQVSAISFDDTEPIDYGTVPETSEEL